jgi:hypothetical protein
MGNKYKMELLGAILPRGSGGGDAKSETEGQAISPMEQSVWDSTLPLEEDGMSIPPEDEPDFVISDRMRKSLDEIEIAAHEGLIATANTLASPEKAKNAVRGIATFMDPSLVEKVAVPLSEMATILKNAHVDYKTGKVVGYSVIGFEEARSRFEAVMSEKYGPNFKVSLTEKQRDQLSQIYDIFGMDI